VSVDRALTLARDALACVDRLRDQLAAVDLPVEHRKVDEPFSAALARLRESSGESPELSSTPRREAA